MGELDKEIGWSEKHQIYCTLLELQNWLQYHPQKRIL